MIRPPRSTTSCLLLLLLSFFTSDNLSLATSFSPQVFTPSRLGDRNVHRHYDNGEKRTERITPTTMYGLRGGGIGNNIQNVYGKYMSLLETSPISTKSITAGVVQALGDLLSQFIEAKVANVPFILNKYRLQGFLISGVFFVGPFLHYWYNFLWRIGDWAKNKLKAGKNMQTLLQVFTDQTLGVAIFFPLYFYVFELADALSSWRVPAMAIAHAKCKAEIYNVVVTQYYIWPITNWCNFAYVPENLRVLFSNIISVFWNAYLCSRLAK